MVVAGHCRVTCLLYSICDLILWIKDGTYLIKAVKSALTAILMIAIMQSDIKS